MLGLTYFGREYVTVFDSEPHTELESYCDVMVDPVIASKNIAR